MNPDLSTLLKHWLRYITPDTACQAATRPASLDNVSRHRIAHIIVDELSAMDALHTPDASRPARAFVELAVACNLQPSDMKCEANALCLAVLNADLRSRNEGVDIPVGHAMYYVDSFSERVNAYYLNSIAVEYSPKNCQANSPRQPERLQHALRSPLQGAMLFLDLVHEDAKHGAVAVEDVDCAIDSLRNIARLLDTCRDQDN